MSLSLRSSLSARPSAALRRAAPRAAQPAAPRAAPALQALALAGALLAAPAPAHAKFNPNAVSNPSAAAPVEQPKKLFQSEDFFKKKPKADKPKANKPSAPAFKFSGPKFSAPKFSAPKVSAPNVDISLPGPANDKQEAALVGGIAVLAAALTSSVVGGLTKRA